MISREKSMPVFAASTPMSEKTARVARAGWRHSCTAVTPGVFGSQGHDRLVVTAGARRPEVGLDAGAGRSPSRRW
jgi:hypothetical protein